MLEAQHRGLDKQYAQGQKEQDLYSLYLSLDAKKDSVIAQSEIITALSEKESFVIVGRAADYVLRERENVIRIFLYAPMDYKVKNVMRIYGDSALEAQKRILSSDKARADYYELVSNQKWGDKGNYHLCLDCSVGNDEIVNTICNYISKFQHRC